MSYDASGKSATEFEHLQAYRFSFTLTKQEVQAFCKDWQRERRLSDRLLNWFGAVALGGVCIAIAIDSLINPLGTGDFVIGLCWVAGGLFAASYIVLGYRWRFASAVRKMQSEGDEMFKPQEWMLSPNGVSVHASLSQSEWRWQAILKIVEADNAVYIGLTRLSALILPLRVIQEANLDIAEVVADLRQWRAMEPAQEQKCPNCGYDLKGSVIQGCPECGWIRDSMSETQ